MMFTLSENFIGSCALATNSILRSVLGPGWFLTHLLTGSQEEFVVDNLKAITQNLAAESTSFEAAMQAQFGNHTGHGRVNAF
eukprot:15281845-Ditylum_brightwellii.AAC.1